MGTAQTRPVLVIGSPGSGRRTIVNKLASDESKPTQLDPLFERKVTHGPNVYRMRVLIGRRYERQIGMLETLAGLSSADTGVERDGATVGSAARQRPQSLFALLPHDIIGIIRSYLRVEALADAESTARFDWPSALWDAKNTPLHAAVVLVIDAGDHASIAWGKAFVSVLLERKTLLCPLLVYGNKYDLPEPVQLGIVCDTIGLNAFHLQQWYIQRCCAQTGDGLMEGLQWISMSLKKASK